MARFYTFLFLIIAGITPGCLNAKSQQPFITRPAVQNFIDTLVVDKHVDRQWLTQLLSEVKLQPKVIALMKRPAESKPWYKYRPIFITPKRAALGAKFWEEHAALLSKAEKKYGVPANVIVAIIGVESFYGRHRGQYRVLDSLATLAFEYPPRSKFFKKELGEFILLLKDKKLVSRNILGSYAGAMGQPQFIPSSVRSFAVDFGGNGAMDLQDNIADIVGSVANYFHKHGWQPGAPIAALANVNAPQTKLPKDITNLKPATTVGQLVKYGVAPKQKIKLSLKASVIELQDKAKPEFWLGFNNFYVITRYNHSPLYAMAVYQLSQKIKAIKDKDEKQAAV